MPKEKTKEQRIKTEWSRLKAIYSDLPDSKKAIVFPLLQNLAFMKITLDDLQQSINENGCSEDYKNGENQYGRKAAADLQAYNSLIKNYNAVSDRLEKLLPPEKKDRQGSFFMEFSPDLVRRFLKIFEKKRNKKRVNENVLQKKRMLINPHKHWKTTLQQQKSHQSKD